MNKKDRTIEQLKKYLPEKICLLNSYTIESCIKATIAVAPTYFTEQQQEEIKNCIAILKECEKTEENIKSNERLIALTERDLEWAKDSIIRGSKNTWLVDKIVYEFIICDGDLIDQRLMALKDYEGKKFSISSTESGT